MAGELSRYFLRKHPRDAARMLEAARPADLKAFLDGLDADDQAAALAGLLPETAAMYINECADEVAVAIVERLRVADAARALAALPPTRRTVLLEMLSVERRENVRHRLRYPDDSVGAVMSTRTLVCRDDADIRHAKKVVRRFGATELPIIVVVDDDMCPCGLLPVSKLISARERDPVTAHMRSVPARLRANEEIRYVLHSSYWTNEDYLPVVQAENHYVGLLAKAQLHAFVAGSRRRMRDGDNLSVTMVALADVLWSPAADLLARAGTVSLEHEHE